MKQILFIFLAFLIQANLWANVHPYSITQVTADIKEHSITLSIRTNAEDLVYFHPLSFDPSFNISQENLKLTAEQHSQTIQGAFYIVDQNSNRLQASISNVNVSSLNSKNTFNIMELMKFPLYYTLEFQLDDKTDLLIFHQDLSDAGLPAVSLLSVRKNGNELVQNIEVTKENPFAMARHAVSIGTPADANFVVSYITLSDTRITHELTLPASLLKSFVSLNLANPDSAQKELQEFLAVNTSVEINNTFISPDEIVLDFQRDSVSTLNNSYLVYIRIGYSMTSLPKQVSVSWNSFNWQVRWFKSLIDAFGKKTEHNFSRFEPKFSVERNMEIKKEEGH